MAPVNLLNEAFMAATPPGALVAVLNGGVAAVFIAASVWGRERFSGGLQGRTKDKAA